MTALSASPERLQRAVGEGALTVKLRDGATRIDTLYQSGAAKIRLPRGGGDGLEAVLINTAGGMTGGDRLAWTVAAPPGCAVTLTTQAAEKVYRALSGVARLETALRIGGGAGIAWLPQETILFDGSALDRSLTVDMDPGARCLALESVVFGRRAMDETVRRGIFRDRWTVSMAGVPLHVEAVRIEGDVRDRLARAAVLAGAGAMATLLLVCEDAVDRVVPLRRVLETSDNGVAGVSALPVGKLASFLPEW